MNPEDDVATQAYDNMSPGNVQDEELLTLEYGLDPVTSDAETRDDKQESQTSDTVPTQVISEFDTLCLLWPLCLQCFDAVGWAAGRASSL